MTTTPLIKLYSAYLTREIRIFTIIALLMVVFIGTNGQYIQRVGASPCVGVENIFTFSGTGSVTWGVSTGATVISNTGNALRVKWNSATTSASVWAKYPTGTEYYPPFTIRSAPVLSVSISANKNNVCQGTSVIFTASPTNAMSPTYSWKVDGSAAPNATNSPTYTTSGLTNGQKVTCTVISSDPCQAVNTVTSNAVTMIINTPQTFNVTITGASGVCALAGTSFGVSAVSNAVGNLSYQWKKNGINVSSNITGPPPQALALFPVNNYDVYKTGDIITCVVTTDASCYGASTSNALTITVNPTQAFTVSVNPGKVNYCAGDPVTLKAESSLAMSGFQWSLNGAEINQATSNTYTTTAVSATQLKGLSVRANASGGVCLENSTATSTNNQTIPYAVNLLPNLPTVQQPFYVLYNTPTTLTASGASNVESYKWYTAATGGTALTNIVTPNITVPTTYYVSKLSASNCESSSRTPYILTPNFAPVVSAGADLTVNLPFNEVTLNGSATDDDGNVSSYLWTQVSGEHVDILNSTSSTTTVSNLHFGNYTFRLTAKDIHNFENYDDVYVNVSYPPNDYNWVKETTVLVDDKTAISQLPDLSVYEKSVTTNYYDGLGRTMQTVVTKGSPDQLDIVQPVIYDAIGRETVKYLPYVSSETNGYYKINSTGETTGSYTTSPQYAFYNNGLNDGIADDVSPYASTVFENSVLNRIVKQGAPGTAWQPDTSLYAAPTDHTIVHSYQTNIDNEVMLFVYDNTTRLLGGSTFYTKNQLFANKTKDEHHNETIEYTDKDGHVVCRKIQLGIDASSTIVYTQTYYVYDDFGNLVVVLPPEATVRLSTEYQQTGATNTSKDAFLKKWAFRYTYDARQRMIQRQVPGTDPVYLVYDDRDRLVMTQDGNQRANKYWSFTKYDALNRPVLTGIYQADVVLLQSEMQQRVYTFYNAVPGNGGAWYESYTGGPIHGYDNKSYPQETTPDNYLTVNYYDNYTFRNSWIGYGYASDALTTTVATITYTQIATGNENVANIGQLTGTKTKVLDGGVRGGSTWLRSINYFDSKYHLIQKQTDNIRGGKDVVSNLYDFSGKVIMTKTTHSTSIPSSYGITRRFIYDHASRLTEVWHKIGTGTDYRIVSNQYNKLGQLIDKKLHSTTAAAADNKQSVDYRYNIRGWLTSMNNSQLTNDAISTNTNDDTGDLFGMNLLYNDADANLGNSGLYNGNISGMKWSTNLGLSDIRETGYNFAYDPLNRLRAANSKMNKTSTWQAGNYNENGLSYDLNGNIIRLLRNGDNGLQIDRLRYGYTGNQLQYVQDSAASASGLKGFADFNSGTAVDYTYDANGNMTHDLNKGIGTSTTDATNIISYNYLNLPETVTKAGNTVRYIYDAAGKKLSQVVTVGATQKRTDYIGEFQYENNALQFITHEEGRVVLSATRLVYSNSFDVVSAEVSQNGIQTPVIYTNSVGEKYLKITSAGTANGTGTPQIGSLYTVQPGERYRIRAKGYSTAAPVYLQVQVGGSIVGSPGTKLPNSAATESWVEQIVIIPAGGTTTLKAGIVWNNAVAGESYYLNEFEISQLTTQAPEYQYNLKDHLGNVRLTFTTKPEIVSDVATLESASESNKFLRYDNARLVGHYLFDHTNGSSPTTVSGTAQRLSGQTNEVYGIAKSLSVMPGDVIAMEVYAKYIDKTPSNRTAALNTLLSQVAAGTGGGANVVDGGKYLSSTVSFPYYGLNGTTGSTGTGPKAYLNWVVFDKNFNVIPSFTGFRRLTATPKETGQDIAHEKLSNTLTITEPGYVYIYYSNEEGASAYEVYFDDFKVTQTKSAVISSQDYYPFGLTYNSYQRENSIKNNNLFNAGAERQDDLGLNWDYTRYRTYDPTLGSFMQVDPKVNNFYNWDPYNYGFDNPVLNNDPNGDCPVCIALVVGAFLSTLLDANVAEAPGLDRSQATLSREQQTREDLDKANDVVKIVVNPMRVVQQLVKIGGKNMRMSSNPDKPKTPSTNPARTGPPSPGRSGGEPHRRIVAREEKRMQSEGKETAREVKIDTPGGNKEKRFADVVGTDPATGQKEIVQVGKENMNGTPVSRERKAIDDIESATKEKVNFVPYNKDQK